MRKPVGMNEWACGQVLLCYVAAADHHTTMTRTEGCFKVAEHMDVEPCPVGCGAWKYRLCCRDNGHWSNQAMCFHHRVSSRVSFFIPDSFTSAGSLYIFRWKLKTHLLQLYLE